MQEPEKFREAINTFKRVSPRITKEQRMGLLQQAVQQYGLSPDAAAALLKASGLVVGERIDYFEVLGLSVEELEPLDERDIVIRVEAAHKVRYNESLQAGARVRPDGRTEDQWRSVLNQARDTLRDAQKRQEYVTTLFPEEEAGVPEAIEQHLASDPEAEKPGIWHRFFAKIRLNASVESNSVATSPPIDVPRDMVLIPAGRFQRDSNDRHAYKDEYPVHRIYVDAFYVDTHQVTNAEYQRFVLENPQWQKERIPPSLHDGRYLSHWEGTNYPGGKAHHPVVYVSWYGAMAYAAWAGKRLPTEAEWEKAARGGKEGLKYPWGNTITPANANYGRNVGDTTAVGSYAANGYGLHDMVGNVWEWCLDAYDENFYATSPGRNPLCDVNTIANLALIVDDYRNVMSDCVLRGGGWISFPRTLRAARRLRNPPTLSGDVVGFRCVRAITP